MKSLFSLLLIMCCLNIHAQNKPQNIVFILVDDLGWTDLGYMGSDFYETPHIDSLSKESFVFDNAYSSSSVCSPSRSAIMTGKHPARVNITDWIPGQDPKNRELLGPQDLNALPLEEQTIAEVLKEHGYSTFFAGKWHLGGDGFLPDDQGFDVNIGGNHTGQPKGGYYSPYDNPQLADGEEGEYLTDRLTDESIHYLKTVRDKPFFLFLPFYTVHTPIQPNDRHLARFEDKLKQLDRRIEFRVEKDSKTTCSQRNPKYASMVYTLDENIGRLLDALKTNGLYENTTIIFTSDNGGLTTLLTKYNYEAPSSVMPLRAGKGWLYEGGIRVPLLVKPANYSGNYKTISEPVIGHDFYPTIMALSNIELSKDKAIDGKDFSTLFQHEIKLRRKALFWHYPHYHGSGWRPGAAIRVGDWKLIEFYESGTVELYNLAEDISEQNDLSLAYPWKSKFLRMRLHKLQRSVSANTPKRNIHYREEPR